MTVPVVQIVIFGKSPKDLSRVPKHKKYLKIYLK